jgi:hypothetical protein
MDAINEAMLNHPPTAFKRKFVDILHSRKWKMQRIETGLKF